MLSESQNRVTSVLPGEALAKLPKLAQPKTVRVAFRKVGKLQYISHLDLQRTLHRMIIRAGVPVWFTQGFNPHAKVIFAAPLSVGTESECERLDLRIDREMSCEEIKDRLNREVTDELRILEVYEPTEKFSEIGYADYQYKLCFEGAGPAWAERIKTTLTTGQLLVRKRTKSGEKDLDIIPSVASLDVTWDENEGVLKMHAILTAGADNYQNPEALITGLKQVHNLFAGDPTKEWYTILRTKLLRNDFREFR